MPDDQSSAEETPSAEVLQERMDELHRKTNLGEGNEEPDPATAENPPRDSGQGDRKREQT
jgi:hypothetical protein